MTQTNFLFMLIPALVALGGGVLAMYWHPSHQMRSLIQHFAAGVVLAALAVELLPEIGREHAPGSVLIAPTKNGLAWGLLVATFIDIAVDGFIIGAGFAAGGETGMILSLGLSVELLFLGLALTSESTKGWRIVAISGALAVTVLVCAVLGNILLSGASNAVIAAALAFSAAALLYLVTEELLIEAHTVEEQPIATLVLFSGFLVFWSIQLSGS
jgi:ZIP family zinc transporter